MTFTTGHFTEFAILYRLKQNENNNNNNTPTPDYTAYYNNLYAAALNNAALTANYKRVLDSVPRTGDLLGNVPECVEEGSPDPKGPALRRFARDDKEMNTWDGRGMKVRVIKDYMLRMIEKYMHGITMHGK